MLTSRERVRRVLARQPVDRIPNGLGGCETAGMHLLAYETLKSILGCQGEQGRMTTFMTTAMVEPSVLEAMDGDMILLGSHKLCPARFWGPGYEADWKEEEFWGKPFRVPRQWTFRTTPDGTIWWDDHHSKCPPGAIYFDIYALSQSIEALMTAEQPSPDDYHPAHTLPEEALRGLEQAARWLHEHTTYSIVCGETITDLQLKPGGAQSWWMRLVQDPSAVNDFLAKTVEAALSQLVELDQAVGSYADLLQIADDIGDSRGVLIGPDLWRETYKPHYMRLFQEWHRITNMKVSLHCCGSAVDVLDDLIECGIDVFNPVQISARGMDPSTLKERFGNRLVFYGGAYDAVCTPNHTPAEQVYDEVRSNIETLAQGGGYIFAGVHNIPGDIPETHLEAILEAYRDTRSLM